MADLEPSTPGKLMERIAELEFEIDQLLFATKPVREQLASLDRERAKLDNERIRLSKLREEMHSAIEVSDHALVRYMERKLGFDLEAIRSEILSEAVKCAVNSQAEGVKTADGVFKIKGRVITTFMTGKSGHG